jgi:hypothetical protein
MNTKKLYEVANNTGVEYMLIVATSVEKAIKYANKFSELVDPDYEEFNIVKSIDVASSNRIGLYTILHSSVGEFTM